MALNRDVEVKDKIIAYNDLYGIEAPISPKTSVVRRQHDCFMTQAADTDWKSLNPKTSKTSTHKHKPHTEKPTLG